MSYPSNAGYGPDIPDPAMEDVVICEICDDEWHAYDDDEMNPIGNYSIGLCIDCEHNAEPASLKAWSYDED